MFRVVENLWGKGGGGGIGIGFSGIDMMTKDHQSTPSSKRFHPASFTIIPPPPMNPQKSSDMLHNPWTASILPLDKHPIP